MTLTKLLLGDWAARALGVIALVTIIGGLIFLSSGDTGDGDRTNRLTKPCDEIFGEFMTSPDAAVVQRDAWLLYFFHCDISNRYLKRSAA